MANSLQDLAVSTGYVQLLHMASGLSSTEDYIRDGDGTASTLSLGTTSATIGGDLIISGDLTISGTTTTVNTETINLADNILTLNSNATGTPSENAGFEIERGTSTNTNLLWDESTDRFKFTNDGSTYYNIPTTAEYDLTPSWVPSSDPSYLTAYTNTMGAGFKIADGDSNVDITEGEYLKFTTESGGSGVGIISGSGTSVDPYVYTLKYTGTYSVMNSANAYASGLVPSGAEVHSSKFLRKDGTWVVPTDTQYAAVDFAHDSLSGYDADEHIDWTIDQGTTNVHSGNYTDTNTTYGTFSGTAEGLVPESTINDDTKFLRADGTWVVPTDTTYAAVDFSHDSLSAVDANEHIDWTVDQGTTNVHSGNYTNDTYGTFSGTTIGLVPESTLNDDTKFLRADGTWVVPTDTTYAAVDFAHDSLSSVDANEHIDWTIDQGTTNIHSGNYIGSTYSSFTGTTEGLVPESTLNDDTKFLRADGTWVVPTDTTYAAVDFSHDSLSSVDADEHIDWTISNAKNIHSGNYTDTNTTYSVGDGGLTQNNFTNSLKSNYDDAYQHSTSLVDHLELGSSSSTAYRGDRGTTAYNYSQVGHLPLGGGNMTGVLNIDAGTANGSNDATLYVTASNNNDWGIRVNSNSGKTEYGISLEMPASYTYGLRITGGGTEHFRISSSNALYKSNVMLHAGNYSSYALPLSGGTMTDNIHFGNYGEGIVGVYSATRYQAVFSMGNSYKLANDGTTAGSLYGIAWTHSNVGGQSISGLSHQALFMHNGVTKSAIGSGIWTSGAVTWSGGSSTNANTAYTYSQVGHLPLGGGTLSGNITSSSGMKVILDNGVGADTGAGIYWDSTSTAYAIFREAGAWTNPYPDLCIAFHTGIKMGANAGYGGIRMYTDYNMATELFSVGDGDTHVRVANNIYWSGGNSANANTAYSWGNHGCPNNSSNPTFSTNVQSPDFYATGWFRNSTNKKGLYNSANARHFYNKDGNWELDCAEGIKFVQSHDGSAVMYPAYKNSNGVGMLMGGSWWIQSPRESSTEVCIGGHEGNNPYNSVSSTRLMFGGGDTNGRDSYFIGTNMENYGGNYTKLDLRWHTGIRMGAQPSYGGIRMYDTEALGTLLFSVGETDGNVRVTNDLHCNSYVITQSSAKWYNINSSYLGFSTWIQSSGSHGLYLPSGGAGDHWYPSAGSYCSFNMNGQKNGYSGIHQAHSGMYSIMYDSSGNGGEYSNNSIWYTYFHRGNRCMGINSSSTSSSYALYVTGAIYSTGDVVAYSDARIKTNVKLIDSPLDKVMAMRGVYYNRIDEGELTSRKAVGERCVGMIAQELNEVLPEAVTYAKDIDRYGIDYGKVTSVLIEAIKELKNEVNELRNKYGVN